MSKIYQKSFSGGKTAGFMLMELLLNQRHSRGMLSGIFRFLSCCLGLINGRKAGDPRQKHSGMTAFNTCRITTSCGFTLIELLVVVLIIGILAAIALPQYQKAVFKARAIQYLAGFDALVEGQTVYYLANGEYAEDLAALDITLPDMGKYASYMPKDLGICVLAEPLFFQYQEKTHVKICNARPERPDANAFCASIGTLYELGTPGSQGNWNRYKMK